MLLALLVAVVATLPAAASIPRELPSWLTDDPLPDVPTPPPETASEPARFTLYEVAVWAEGRWRLPQRAAVAEAYAKTRVWGLETLCLAQSQENKRLKARIAEGVCDGPSQYIFAGYDPVNMSDPLGLYVGYTTPEEAKTAMGIGEATLRRQQQERERSEAELIQVAASFLESAGSLSMEDMRIGVGKNFRAKGYARNQTEALWLSNWIFSDGSGKSPCDADFTPICGFEGMTEQAEFFELSAHAAAFMIGGVEAPLMEMPLTLRTSYAYRAGLFRGAPRINLASPSVLRGTRRFRSRGISLAESSRLREIRLVLDAGKDRTVGFARVNVNGSYEELATVSGKAYRGHSVSGTRVVGNTARTGPGSLDAEAKILDDISSRFDPSARGVVQLFVDRPVCTNCSSVILSFRATYPNINLIVAAP